MQITPNVKKQWTANNHDDLENPSEQREIDSIEEPVRKKDDRKKYWLNRSLQSALVDRERLPRFCRLSLDKFPFDFQIITAEITKLSGEVLNVNS